MRVTRWIAREHILVLTIDEDIFDSILEVCRCVGSQWYLTEEVRCDIFDLVYESFLTVLIRDDLHSFEVHPTFYKQRRREARKVAGVLIDNM